MSLVLICRGYIGDEWVSTTMTGHPPIPDVVVELRRAVLSPPGYAPSWCDRSSHPWGAVLRLQRAGCHDAATALARLLIWCEAQDRRSWIWEIREEASDG